MIKETKAYYCECDGCGDIMYQCVSDKDLLAEIMDDEGWVEVDGKVYCPECAKNLKNK